MLYLPNRGHISNKQKRKIPWITAIALFAALVGGCGGGAAGNQQADPLVVDYPIAYVKRSLPVDDDGNIISEDILTPESFGFGATLYLRSRGSSSATETAIAGGANYDIKDLEVSYDGEKLVFAMRGPLDPDANDEDQPSWNIWEYDTVSGLQALIGDANKAEEGHDISPAYLPDGRIIFSSNRQVGGRLILLDELKSGFSAVAGNNSDDEIFSLHITDPVNDPNGINMRQISFNQGHDLQPAVLADGRIAFLRWDTGEGNNHLSIYTVNSDGSNLQLLYGYHSQRTGNDNNNLTTFIDVREQADGSLIAILQARNSAVLGGDIISIDSQGFTDLNQPTANNSGDTGTGQASLSAAPVNLGNGISTHGYFNSAYQLADNSERFLVSWSLCRLRNPVDGTILACSASNMANTRLEVAPPAYGIWIYDSNGTQTPIVTATQGEMYTDVVIMEPRTLPPVSATDVDTTLDTGFAALHIHSVYDTDGNDTSSAGISTLADPALTLAGERPARFLRLIKAVSIPSDDVRDFDDSAFGINGNRGMREILGYVPIEPDGSVLTQVPANVAFSFDVVDVNGERISALHSNWLHLKEGETYQCHGCHAGGNSELPHGRINAQADPVNSGTPVDIGPYFINTALDNDAGGAYDVELGDTMAEVYAKMPDGGASVNGPRPLASGLIYTDDWTDDPTVRVKDADYNLRYDGDLSFAAITTPQPVDTRCQTNWQVFCRIVINYTQHIQPLWEINRIDGADNNQCIACHSRTDELSNPQQPAGQLELTSGASTEEPAHLVAYRELFETNLPQILNPDGDGFLPLFVLDIVNGVQQFYLDVDDNPILDSDDNPIPQVRLAVAGDNNLRIQSFTGNVVDIYLNTSNNPILDANGNEIEITVAVDSSDLSPGPSMITSNAAGSRFFDKLNGVNLPATVSPVDHTDFMNINELRLLREWVDIGAQYYNNPFDAPLD
ncbi:MAG: hypothetical protein KTR20_15495 [Cellvibrionaceae bacterium]|nr:hypothetical protein [Cellvibrionaceae bacterium]